MTTTKHMGCNKRTVPVYMSSDSDQPRYNLQGQRVGKDYKGVVIVNGRKMIP